MNNKMKKSKMIGLRVNEAQEEAIQKLVTEKGLSQSGAVQFMINQFMITNSK
ncbi:MULTISPECIES: hypothetical protein [unclassified Tatumella]|uniref:hypothetical protein n=1 Tax=unclassified Tatumella TaxID=2649542 RepID=UPI001BAFB3F2|nr:MULTISPECIES: hypothetical protein [unclassified Tatumella]MBS0876518.1 hypothetical protein [Tatumella sp. JGM82]MBS0889691.1 hypothetical protein [Tatumella sp. JGM94]MBS0900813.1 hypothetical protein [Tatumella sp. JGM100]